MPFSKTRCYEDQQEEEEEEVGGGDETNKFKEET